MGHTQHPEDIFSQIYVSNIVPLINETFIYDRLCAGLLDRSLQERWCKLRDSKFYGGFVVSTFENNMDWLQKSGHQSQFRVPFIHVLIDIDPNTSRHLISGIAACSSRISYIEKTLIKHQQLCVNVYRSIIAMGFDIHTQNYSHFIEKQYNSVIVVFTIYLILYPIVTSPI